MVRVRFLRWNTFIYEELANQSSHCFLDLNIFFRLFCLAAEDLYNDGAIGSDESVCRTLCDLCIRLDGSPSCEDRHIAIMQKIKSKYSILYIIM